MPASKPDVPPTTVVSVRSDQADSIDVLAPDGSRLCRINLFYFGDGRGNIDVILNGKEQRGEFIAWDRGATQHRHMTKPGTTVHAVNIVPDGSEGVVMSKAAEAQLKAWKACR